ncbi:MAG: hypothetical protein MUO37_04930 [Methyloceanibacter sp.]|nr:hypothetical protein [Methyloceanibacter sp.]
MISPDVVQAAIIALLKADAPLVASLAADPARIKEADWRGTDFEYPAVRVDITDMRPTGNGNCSEQRQGVTGSIIVYSKVDSSAEAAALLGLVQNAIQQKHLVGAGMSSQVMRPIETHFPYRDNDIWRGEVVFATTVFEV